MNTAIKTYLDNRAATDNLFAKKYANPKKSIKECCEYITGEAYARAKNGMAVISDEEVYGMAVHYYDEENIEIRKAPRSRTEAQQPTLTTEQQEELRKQAEKEYKAKVKADLELKEIERKSKLREKKKAQPQMASLFDL